MKLHTRVFIILCAVSLVWASLPSNHRPCGNNVCRCGRSTHNRTIQYMDCSNQSLTYIPKAPKLDKTSPTYIFFKNNSLTVVNSATFRNISRLKVVFLRLRRNGIVNISSDAFSALPYLQGLDVSYNSINLQQLRTSFRSLKNKNFQNLNMSHMNIESIPENMFASFGNLSSVTISLAFNSLKLISPEQIENVPGLQFLNLAWNKLSNVSMWENLTSNMKKLRLDNNYFDAFPNFCKNDSHSLFPKLERLNLQFNFMRTIISEHYSCLNTLQILYLNGNLFKTLKSNMFAGLHSLENIKLSEIFALLKIEKAPFNNTSLKKAFFRKNALYTERPEISLNIFEGCTSLDLLNLADNILDKTPEEQFDQLFKPIRNLTYLIMGGCRLTRIPKAVTKYLHNLRVLVLYNNRIGSWPDGTLNSLVYLDTIYMRENVISVVSESSFPPGFRRRAKHIELFYNSFQCTCELKWFIDWMKERPRVFHLPEFSINYTCMSPASVHGVVLEDIPLSENICLLGLNSKIITLTCSTLLLVLLVVGSVLYRLRWYIQYLVYMIRYRNRHETDTGHYEYDAFIAYSVADRPWVIKTLMPILEGEGKLNLCIHDRDFEIGKLIVDNIVDCIENSRCLVILLSNSFAQSDWCQFELALIQRYVLENGNRLLVVVMLEDIHTSHMTKAMTAMLQTTTYLQWGEEDYARTAFFNRLRLLLRRPIQRARIRTNSV
ncbi:toll-like receptor 13 [Haliotis rubra]|uniref:toll-like receptor 13 n=1 Tax=Haliotis rubra TaxID=36100 RepID=UPI001EE5797C|nr:toll-like receptor 13 [Haliotis rubra]XP_046548717.1 toll-like receptor 13 [Haliotis rubra]XP_046548718.1 toll-like receptor 13 [Haliotis rubra]